MIILDANISINYSHYQLFRVHMLLTIYFIQFQKIPDERRKERCANKILAFAEQTDDISPNYSSKIKKMALTCTIQLYFVFDNLNR